MARATFWDLLTEIVPGVGDADGLSSLSEITGVAPVVIKRALSEEHPPTLVEALRITEGVNRLFRALGIEAQTMEEIFPRWYRKKGQGK